MPANSSRQIRLGPLRVGGGAPVLVQSMTNTDTRDSEATLRQIEQLAGAGCEAVRIAIPDESAVCSARVIVDKAPIPVFADIHFDWRLAIAALEAGCVCVRINPGNIGGRENTFRVADAARANDAALRIGVNSGSLQKDILAKHGAPTPAALAESGAAHARLLEDRGFYNFKISVKSSSVTDTIEACRAMRALCDCPLHLGVTEAGTLVRGVIKSAIGIGILLHEGIGDTLRVSLTCDPVEEVRAAWQILASLGLRRRGPEIISCPTCGRTEIDLMALARAVEEALADCALPLRVAVMGCVVNGPGEAANADIGLAGGRDKGIIFRKGRVVRSVRGQGALLEAFLSELKSLIAERSGAGSPF